MSRLLDPRAFGLVAMAATFVTLGAVVSDLGLSLATVQSIELSHRQSDSILTLALLVGVITSLVLAALSAPLAWLYNEPTLKWVVAWLAVCFPFSAVTAQVRSLLVREEKHFGATMPDAIGAVIGLGAGIAAAKAGAGVWSLVVQQVVGAASATTIALPMLDRFPRPASPFKGVGHLVRYGSAAGGTQIMNYVSSNLDNFLVGRTLGASQLGLYSRSYQLSLLPVQQTLAPLTRIAVRRLSLAHGQGRLDQELKRVHLLLTVLLGIPLALALGLSQAVTALLLGAQWGQASGIFAIFAAGAVMQLHGYVAYWGLLAAGRADRLLTSEMPARLAQIALIVILAPMGTLHAATAYAVGCLLVLLGNTREYVRVGQVSPVKTAVRIIKAVSFQALVAGAAWCCMSLVLPGGHPVLARAALGLAGGFATVGILLLLPGNKTRAKAILGILARQDVIPA